MLKPQATLQLSIAKFNPSTVFQIGTIFYILTYTIVYYILAWVAAGLLYTYGHCVAIPSGQASAAHAHVSQLWRSDRPR